MKTLILLLLLAQPMMAAELPVFDPCYGKPKVGTNYWVRQDQYLYAVGARNDEANFACYANGCDGGVYSCPHCMYFEIVVLDMPDDYLSKGQHLPDILVYKFENQFTKTLSDGFPKKFYVFSVVR